MRERKKRRRESVTKKGEIKKTTVATQTEEERERDRKRERERERERERSTE